MDRLDAMQLFVRVADSGSFSKAAIASRRLPVHGQQAGGRDRVAARRATAAPDHAGSQRHGSGPAILRSILKLIEAVDDAEARVGHASTRADGCASRRDFRCFRAILRVAVPSRILRAYPDVTIDFDISERHANLVQDGIDWLSASVRCPTRHWWRSASAGFAMSRWVRRLT